MKSKKLLTTRLGGMQKVSKVGISKPGKLSFIKPQYRNSIPKNHFLYKPFSGWNEFTQEKCDLSVGSQSNLLNSSWQGEKVMATCSLSFKEKSFLSVGKVAKRSHLLIS